MNILHNPSERTGTPVEEDGTLAQRTFRRISDRPAHISYPARLASSPRHYRDSGRYRGILAAERPSEVPSKGNGMHLGKLGERAGRHPRGRS